VKQRIKDKRVVFITTKNIDYIRNLQEQEIIKNEAKEYYVIGSKSKYYVLRMLQVYFALLFFNFRKVDVVFVGFAPQLVLPVIAWRVRKKEVICDFFISLYDTFVFDRQKFKEGSLAAGCLKKLDQYTIRKSNYVIADTKAHKEYFCEEFGAKENLVEVLYITADHNIYYPRTVERTEYKDKFVVLYFGSILPLQGIDVIVKASKLIQDKDIVLYLIGPVKAGKLPKNVVNVPWMSQTMLAEHIAMADLCLAGHFCGSINKARRTIPGKAYIYEMMEKPMILGENPATHEIFNEDEKHFFVEMSNPQALADKITEISRRVKASETSIH
jgi:glycosyltransferase involved in cell wall biosynthesis